jgi:hypothetical protein
LGNSISSNNNNGGSSSSSGGNSSINSRDSNSDRRQIMGYVVISILGYMMTQQLIPHISLYTLRKNIYGKDLGKKNTATADVPM